MAHTLLSQYINFTDKLKSVYSSGEAESIANIVFEEIFMMKKHHIHIISKEIGEYEISQLDNILKRLLNHEPVQYVLGIADFMGLRFRVNKNVLIPRPETEELVQLIIQDVRKGKSENFRILDIGTGSGCIPIALKRNLPFAGITGIDISEGALEVAKENAFLNKTDIDLIQMDILSGKDALPEVQFDVIVSNPPYIVESEKGLMQKNVLDHEPHTALFVKNDDPIIFYKAIALYALKKLKKSGRLYFEINPLYASQIQSMLEANGFSTIEIQKDMQNDERFISCVL